MNPEAKSAQGVGAKLEAGKHRLEQEIADELRNVENKLNRREKPREDGPKKQR